MIEITEVKDIKELANLASDIWHEYWVDILSPEQIDYMVEKFQSENAILNQIKSENYTYFFIKSEGQNAGYIGLSKKDDYLFLSKLYIKKEFRRRGFGTQAFEFIRKFASENGFDRIVLTVNKYNENTIKAYYKWHFKQINSVVTDIGNGYVMDDYIFEYTL